MPLNTAQLSVIYDALTDHLETVIENMNPKEAAKLLQASINQPKPITDEYFGILIKDSNIAAKTSLNVIRDIYELRYNLNLDKLGDGIVDTGLVKNEIERQVNDHVKDLQEDINLEEQLIGHAKKQAEIIGQYLSSKRILMEKHMLQSVERKEKTLETKVDELSKGIKDLQNTVSQQTAMQQQLIDALKQQFTTIGQQFTTIGQQLDSTRENFNKLKEMTEQMQQQQQQMQQQMQTINDKLDSSKTETEEKRRKYNPGQFK